MNALEASTKHQMAMIEMDLHFISLKLELILMSYDCKTPCPKRSVYLSDNLERTQEIGRMLDSKFGFMGMAIACSKVPELDQRELDVAWNGIGQWQG